jgi:hypothetical protein
MRTAHVSEQPPSFEIRSVLNETLPDATTLAIVWFATRRLDDEGWVASSSMRRSLPGAHAIKNNVFDGVEQNFHIVRGQAWKS